MPPAPGPGSFGSPVQTPTGMSTERYQKMDVKRDDVNYFFMANGWGPKFKSQSVSWSGTSFAVLSMEGDQGDKYEPASYPTVFCGAYSDSKSGACGLPATISSLTSIKTGWSWAPNGNAGAYNTSYDIWLGSGETASTLTEYLMVWLRDPPGAQPAGGVRQSNIKVPNVPGEWNLWVGPGAINGKDYYAYVRPEGKDIYSIEFDVMDLVRDLPSRQITLKGTHVLSVAVGFEIWKGPVSNLVSTDFYVKVN